MLFTIIWTDWKLKNRTMAREDRPADKFSPGERNPKIISRKSVYVVDKRIAPADNHDIGALTS